MKHLPRRTFLRGLGAAFGLPLLDSMIPALTAQRKTVAKPQLRFGAIYHPNGTVPKFWIPAKSGKDFELTEPLKPLEPFRDQLTVVSGMTAQNPLNLPHLSAGSMWLNGVGPQVQETDSVREDITIDQRIAAKIGQDTAFPSIEIATEDMSRSIGSCDAGFSCIYMSTISWRTPTTPLPMEINPRVLFERMFGDPGTPQERLERLEYKRSILDAVTGQASRMKGALGAGDRNRMDAYLENIREIERRIQNAEASTRQQTSANLSVPDAPAGVPASYDEHVKLLYDLQFIALQTDLTRVFTFMIAHEASDIPYPWIGVTEGHHSTSHHSNNPEKMANHIKINNYHCSLLAYFLEKLKKTPDGDGTLLDHTLLFYGSGMGEGNGHERKNLPLLVLGGTSFGVDGGRHIAHEKPAPMTNLLLSLLDKAEIHLDSIGDSNARVDL